MRPAQYPGGQLPDNSQPAPLKLTNAQKDAQAFHRWLTKRYPGMASDNPQYEVLRRAFIAGRQSGIASCSTRPKRAAPRVEILSVNFADQKLAVLVGDRRYSYEVRDGFRLLVDQLQHWLKTGQHGKALATLKRRACLSASN